MQTGVERQTKRLGDRADHESDDAPVMAPKVTRFALRLAVLMQGHYPGHAAGLFDHIGVIAHQDHAARDHDGDLLAQHELTPVSDEGIEAPGRRMEKV